METIELEKFIRQKHLGDKEQIDFIFSNDNKIIVTAPAGCGKTTAMVSKIARELSEGRIPSNKKVLAMTFSVNAAMKIKDSLKSLLPELVKNPQQIIKKIDIANYHNFAMRILAKYGYYLNQELTKLPDFKIVNENSSVIKYYITEEERKVLEKVSIAIENSDRASLDEKISSYWNILNNKLITNHIITYNGILISVIKLLQSKEIEVSNFYKQYYHMIIIDEFQDTNLLGFLLIKKLINNNMLILLGDNVQKIYGFLGAMDGLFHIINKKEDFAEIKFHNNYRFSQNKRMKDLDLFIRDCAENYSSSQLKASVLVKQFDNCQKEDTFIVDGINKILSVTNNKVAILLRVSSYGNSIAKQLDQKGISYFNFLFKEKDDEFLKFYSVALEEFCSIDSNKAVQSNLKKCLKAIKSREKEIYTDLDKKFIFDALYELLEILFVESKKWQGTSKDKYNNIRFILENKSLKHMMEFINKKVILTTIHAAKGLEWDYVIIPKFNDFIFPTSHMCKLCQNIKSYNQGLNYCNFLYEDSIKRKFKEELSIFYVAVTRAKKEVFITATIGKDERGIQKRSSCLLNLNGLTKEDYNWKDIFNDERKK